MYSEDMNGHAVIGEAAFNLAVREQEITVETLMAELKLMLKAESLSGSRSQRISDAIGWLHEFRILSKREVAYLTSTSRARQPRLQSFFRPIMKMK